MIFDFDSQEEEVIQEEVCEDVTEEKCVNFEVIIYKLVKEDRFFLNFSFVASVFLKLFSFFLYFYFNFDFLLAIWSKRSYIQNRLSKV